MSRPVPAMTARARARLTPGDLREPLRGREHRGAGAGVRGPGAADAGALRGGDSVQGRGDVVLNCGDGPARGRDVVQADPGEPAVAVSAEHALQRPLDARAPGPDLSRGQGGQDTGVTLAVGERFQDEAGRLDPGQRRQRR
jgi:hypothetical protein